MTTMIERNTTIPARRSEIYSTASDNQRSPSMFYKAKENLLKITLRLVSLP